MKKYLISFFIIIIVLLTLLITFKPKKITYKGYRYFSKLGVEAVYSENGKFLGTKKKCAFSLISRCEINKQVELEKVN